MDSREHPHQLSITFEHLFTTLHHYGAYPQGGCLMQNIVIYYSLSFEIEVVKTYSERK